LGGIGNTLFLNNTEYAPFQSYQDRQSSEEIKINVVLLHFRMLAISLIDKVRFREPGLYNFIGSGKLVCWMRNGYYFIKDSQVSSVRKRRVLALFWTKKELMLLVPAQMLGHSNGAKGGARNEKKP